MLLKLYFIISNKNFYQKYIIFKFITSMANTFCSMTNLCLFCVYLWVGPPAQHVAPHSDKLRIRQSLVWYRNDNDHPNWNWRRNESVASVNPSPMEKQN